MTAHFPVGERVREALSVTLRGCESLVSEQEWTAKLARSEAMQTPLRIKLGLDPTAPDIHLGHTVVLNKLRQLQDLGHAITLLIGDFTTLIGDPTGRNSARPPLSREQIDANAQTYFRQAALVLDAERTEIRYNSEWFDAMGTRGLVQLASRYTVARMMERNDFHDRFRSGLPIGIHEFLYPLMQGHDSVALRSDLEIGGTDQQFNLLMGRHLQAECGQEPQCILTMPLLEGLDGVEKMSKSKGNTIAVCDDANTMFAKVLSISDALMWRWYPLLSFEPESRIAALRREVEAGRNPKDAKVALAREITTRFHGTAAARAAEEDFALRSAGGVPQDIPEVTVVIGDGEEGPSIGTLCKRVGLTASIGEANRMIDAGGLRVDGCVVSDKALRLGAGVYVLQVGKRKFVRITLKG